MAKKSRTIPFKADLDPRALEDFVSAPTTARATEPRRATPSAASSTAAPAPEVEAAPTAEGADHVASAGKARRKASSSSTTSRKRTGEGKSKGTEGLDQEELARLIDPEAARVQFGFKMPEPLKERLLDYRAATGREMQELVILGTALALLRVEERFGAIPARKEVKVSRSLRAEDLL